MRKKSLRKITFMLLLLFTFSLATVRLCEDPPGVSINSAHYYCYYRNLS